MIRWGVLGLGSIATRFLESLVLHTEGEGYAAASYTAEKRNRFTELYPQMKVYNDYDDLLNDSKVDAVYIALPHADHYKWALKALQKGKAVLCEKPATLSYKETKELCDVSKENGVLFIEGIKTRFIPLVSELKKIDVGKIQRIETSFCYRREFNAEQFLFHPVQGGILYDVGSYCLGMILFWIDSPLKSIESNVKYKHGVDAEDWIELTFQSGQTALLEMSLDEERPRSMTVFGSSGKIEATPFYRPETATMISGNGEIKTFSKEYIYDDFYTEIAEVHDCLKKGIVESPKMTHKDSLKCVELIEIIKNSFEK